MEENVQVAVRIRPVLTGELGLDEVLEVNGNSIILQDAQRHTQADFHRVFQPFNTQSEVFAFVKPGIDSVTQGFNSTILTYGHTGSGKSYTVFGPDLFRNVNNHQLQGLASRSIQAIFQTLRPNLTVSMSVIQLYNEYVYDLIQDKERNVPLKVRENKETGVYIEGLAEFIVEKQEDAMHLLLKGENNRVIRNTRENPLSSRSHVLFSLSLESDVADADGNMFKSKLFICDLAGSERSDKSSKLPEKHLQELKRINLSLSMLGNVIYALSKKKPHIPYRNSKLTYILKSSLGGSTLTYLIATVTSLAQSAHETLQTLSFASKAKTISVFPAKNEMQATDNRLVKKLQREVAYLKEVLNMRQSQEISQKLWLVQEENTKLKQIVQDVSAEEVENLKKENKRIKLQLQKIVEQTGVEPPPDTIESHNIESKPPLRDIKLRIKGKIELAKPPTRSRPMNSEKRGRNLEQIESYREAMAKKAVELLEGEKIKEMKIMRAFERCNARKYSEQHIKYLQEIEKVQKSVARAEMQKEKAILNLEKVKARKIYSSVSPFRATQTMRCFNEMNF